MKLPRLTPQFFLFGLLGALLSGSLWSTRESLVFCEKALYGEVNTLAKGKAIDKAVSFTEVCPELRARNEATLNKWLEVILALMVQYHPPPPN